MKLIKHPTLPSERFVPDADLDRWLAAGWVKGLTESQEQRLDDIEADVTTDSPEVPAAATAADQGQRPSENEGD